MTITASYIPGPGQTDPQAAARAAAIGIGIAPREVPPVYARFATNLPGAIAEYGSGNVAFIHDDGTLTGAQVTTAIQPLVDQQAADLTTVTNRQTLQQRAQAALNANATYLGIGSPTNPQVVAQVANLTKECSALIRLLLQQYDSTSGT